MSFDHPAYKPAGYNSVSPYFVIRDAERFIELLETVFGAKGLRRYHRPDGSIMHAEMKIDDSVIMVGGANETYKQSPLMIHVYVDDVDAVFQKALDAGCETVEAPKQREGDPDRRGSFLDFAGNFWSIGTQIGSEA